MKRLILSALFVIVAEVIYLSAYYDSIHPAGYHRGNMAFFAVIAVFIAIVMAEIESLKRKRGA